MVLFGYDSMEPDTKPPAELAPLNPIRVETALSRYPMHRLARKGSIKIDLSRGDEHGETTFKWKVSYNSEYGQPGPLAYKLDTLIINRRIEEARRPVPRLLKLGSLSDICKELGLADSGKNRGDIKRSLYQNAFAGISARTHYRGTDGTERTLEAGFTRYSVIFTGEKLPSGRKADGVYIMLNDVFIQIINGAMTRPLDYDYLKSLPPAPQRFYELLSYQMYSALKYDRARARLLYSDLCAHAPQTRHTEWKRVRSQMHKVHRPHRESGYIDTVDFQEITDSKGQPDWIMLYKPGPKARVEYRAFAKRGGPSVLEIEPLEEPAIDLSEASELERELIQRGVTAAIASDLVRDHSEEKIRAQVERLEWLVEKKPDKVDDPAAYLVGAIKNDYAAPKGFVSAAERQRRADAKRQREQEAAESRRREQEERARLHAERRQITAYWEALTPEQQAEIDAASKAETSAEDLALERGPFKDTAERNRRERYIRQLLTATGQLPLP